MPDPIDLATVEVSRFEGLLHEKFSALPLDGSPPPVPVELELVRAVPCQLGGIEGRRVPFSLFFNGPAGVPLGQGTYAVNHPQTGEWFVFMVPMAREEDRIQLQAVLN